MALKFSRIAKIFKVNIFITGINSWYHSHKNIKWRDSKLVKDTRVENIS